MILRAQIQRIARDANGLPTTVFLLRDSDPAAPMWTRDPKLAAALDWHEADKLAPTLKAHAVVIGGTATEAERAAPVPGTTRQEKVSYYRRKQQRERDARRAAADAAAAEQAARDHRIVLFQDDMERRKLA